MIVEIITLEDSFSNKVLNQLEGVGEDLCMKSVVFGQTKIMPTCSINLLMR